MAKKQANPGRKRAGAVKAAKTSPAMRGFYILIGVIAVVGIGALSYLSARPKQAAAEWDSTLPKLTAMGHLEGSDSAKLEVIEFADFECPACGQFATLTEPDVRTHLIDSGVVAIRFMDFPLPMHANTWYAHRAAWCAADQGKFWPMHDAIYNYQDSWNTEATNDPNKVLSGIAKGVGLNMDQYAACIAAKKYQAQIQANATEAQNRQVDQTPTFVFGSKVIGGYETFDQFRANVEEAIAAKAAAAKAAAKK
ncbi:MAG TPA: thioredoxin domain-containing protein [Gemmatimonadaceae bacterium]|nr:thioredoxin domain-containing protein [Gemmatimonadaceae bacterium]